jgi:hypothetical protein
VKPWDIYSFVFPEARPHPVVILGLETRLAKKAADKPYKDRRIQRQDTQRRESLRSNENNHL